jgi:hypothetical protein
MVAADELADGERDPPAERGHLLAGLGGVGEGLSRL